jgi:putative SOS response-associated peptidase YedK
MCARFTLFASGDDLTEAFQLAEVPTLFPRYNIAPTQPVAVVRSSPEGAREFRLLRWGLVPSWAQDLSIGNRLLNARSETVADKPAFRAAFRQRRCLVPADGFYEWETVAGKKLPLHFRLTQGGVFAFAGLWERWRAPGGQDVESCTVLTTEANDLVRPVHDRMPVILAPREHAAWLDARQDPQRLQCLLRPYPAGEMKAVPLAPRVNSPRCEGPACLEPRGCPGPLFAGVSPG